MIFIRNDLALIALLKIARIPACSGQAFVWCYVNKKSDTCEVSLVRLWRELRTGGLWGRTMPLKDILVFEYYED